MRLSWEFGDSEAYYQNKINIPGVLLEIKEYLTLSPSLLATSKKLDFL